MTQDEWLTMITDHAPRLRSAGVLSVSLPDGGHVVLAAAEPAPPKEAAPQPLDVLDPLNDPATFGGRLPGYDLSRLELAHEGDA